ncbi:hypothetical protein PAMP_009027 [Pampus punctatissimus]
MSRSPPEERLLYVIAANPSGFFLKGMCSALSEAAADSLCSAARSWVGDPVGRIICCNPSSVM